MFGGNADWPKISEEALGDFLNAVKALCIKFDVNIGHEDWGGGFLIASGYNEEFMSGWFMKARDPNQPWTRKKKKM